MIICAWNIRGLNKSFKQRKFQRFLNKNKIDLVGCFETKVKKLKAPSIQKNLGVEWKFIDNYNSAPNGRIGLDGGLIQ